MTIASDPHSNVLERATAPMRALKDKAHALAE